MNNKKTWFITGCDSGMGHAVAKEVLSRGDVVILTKECPHVQVPDHRSNAADRP